MKILITGGLGFLGSHLVDHLLLDGHQLTILDNLSSNVVSPDHVAERGEVMVKSVSEFTPQSGYDRIYHCASVVGPLGVLPYAGGPLGQSIVNDTLKVLEWAAETDARLLFVSTSEVYGQDGMFTEDVPKEVSSRISARLEYAVGKLLSEIIILNRSKVTSLLANIVRPFNIVGPRQSSQGGFVLPRFLEAAFEGRDLTVFGSGEQVRSFTHVRDIVDAMIAVMESPLRGEVFNVGNPANKLTINDLALLVKRMTKTESNIVHVDPKKIYGPLYEEAFDKIPDISKVRRLVGWEPKLDFQTTIEDTIRHFLRP